MCNKKKEEYLDLIDYRYTNGKLCDLVDYITSCSERVNTRLWIISPFISSKNTFYYLFNVNELVKRKVDFRLITNLNNAAGSSCEILKFFAENGQLKSLDNLHSKLYILDKFSVITSANLTRRGFFYNYETSAANFDDENSMNIFNMLWEKAESVSLTELNNYIEENKKSIFIRDNEILWGKPIRQLPKELTTCSNYPQFIKCYNDLSLRYKGYKRIWSDSPLKYEVDCFLDYLFHHSVNNSSTVYYDNNETNPNVTENTLYECIQEFNEWMKNSETAQSEDRRLEFEKEIKTLIKNKNNYNIQKIQDCFNHCINAYRSNATRFHWKEKFVAQNTPEIVFDYLNKLQKANINEIDSLIQDPPIKCIGSSSAQEILGLIRKDLPIRNENTNAGLRYLGYSV